MSLTPSHPGQESSPWTVYDYRQPVSPLFYQIGDNILRFLFSRSLYVVAEHLKFYIRYFIPYCDQADGRRQHKVWGEFICAYS